MTQAFADPPEDHGRPVYVWQRGWSFAFVPFPGAERIVLSVPIGWAFQPDPERGVVLVNPFGYEVTAGDAAYPAEFTKHGIRIRATTT